MMGPNFKSLPREPIGVLGRSENAKRRPMWSSFSSLNFGSHWATFDFVHFFPLDPPPVGMQSFYHDEQRRGLKESNRHPTLMNLQALLDLGKWAMALAENIFRFF
jgi:hypothetical protein